MTLSRRRRGMITDVGEDVLSEGQSLKQQGVNFDPVDESQSVPLWDNLRGVWTNPVPQHETPIYLRKIVSFCTGCRQSLGNQRQIQQHINNSRDISESHRQAECERSDGEFSCTACDFTTRTGTSTVTRHIREATEQAEVHHDAQVQTMPKFAMTPLAGAQAVLEPLERAKPIGVQRVDGDAPQPRRRRRHRSRRKRNGNG